MVNYYYYYSRFCSVRGMLLSLVQKGSFFNLHTRQKQSSPHILIDCDCTKIAYRNIHHRPETAPPKHTIQYLYLQLVSKKKKCSTSSIACLTQTHWTLEIVSRTRIHYIAWRQYIIDKRFSK